MARTLTGVPTSRGVAFGPVVHLPVTQPGVVVASDLAPADVASFAAGSVLAIATAAGAPLSHASILARSLGIPAVAGLGPDVLDVAAGTLVLVDGDAGRVDVTPGAVALEAAAARQRAEAQRREDVRRFAADPAVTRDGSAVAVVANVGGVEDARAAVAGGADGVGMLRTEFAFLGRDAPPGEDEQYRAYRAVADILGDRPLVVLTLDLGADVPAWDAPPEPNPALGHRGIRLTLDRRELFDDQLRAVARLACDRPIGVMFPMVTAVEELDQARDCLAGAAAAASARLDVGITVEVPAAAVIADTFASQVDFFAIGTNDLTQYTLACDRASAAVAGLADGLHPAVLRLIRCVTEAAAGVGHRPVCVVGELATDPVAIPVLLGLGVTSLSVRPNAVAAVKEVVRTVNMDEARALAAAALAAPSAAAVRALAI